MKKSSFYAIVIGLIFSSCMKQKVQVIGHRGAMGHETENTIASVQKALELNVDMIEIDVFNLKSGETVVFHDERLDRLANAPGKIEEWSLFDLSQVVLEGGHKIPTLQNVLKTIDHRVRLNIELKGSNTANRVDFITKFYIEKRGWKIEDFVISSFNWNELREMRELNPNMPIAILTEDEPAEAIAIAKELKAEAINPNFKMLNSENTAKIKEAGFKIYTWTVNEPEDINAMKELGVDGIISDYPERVR